MRVVKGVVPFMLVLGFAVGVGCAVDKDDKDDKAAPDLKPNQVLLKVPGMT